MAASNNRKNTLTAEYNDPGTDSGRKGAIEAELGTLRREFVDLSFLDTAAIVRVDAAAISPVETRVTVAMQTQVGTAAKISDMVTTIASSAYGAPFYMLHSPPPVSSSGGKKSTAVAVRPATMLPRDGTVVTKSTQPRKLPRHCVFFFWFLRCAGTCTIN